MHKLICVFASLMLASAAGCADDDGGSGDSGVDESRRISSLTDAETTQLCDYLTDQIGERTVDCGGGSTVTIAGSDDCHDSLTAVRSLPDCPATVAQYRACAEAMDAQSDAQLCSFDLPDACAPVFQPSCFPQQ